MNKFVVLILVCMLGIWSCKKETSTGKHTLDLGRFSTEIRKHSANYQVVGVFDGSCSVCIADFIEANMKFSEWEEKWKFPVTFIVETTDPIVFQANIKQFPIKKANIIIDTTYYVSGHNISFENSNIDFYLIDTNRTIIVKGNPFTDKKIMKVYEKYKNQ